VRGKVEGDKGGDNAETDGAKGQPQAIGVRAPFHAVVRKIWPYGLGLAFGTVGFGVIATLYSPAPGEHR
jgi:hypothetical protein